MSRAISNVLDTRMWWACGGCLTIATLVSRQLAARLGSSVGAAFLCALSTLVAVTVTLFGRARLTSLIVDMSALTLSEQLTWWQHGWDTVMARIPADPEWLLNVVLFVPAGVAWTLTTGRPGRVLWALVAGSFAIETIQAITGIGAPDPADWVANSAGALGGVLAAIVVGQFFDKDGGLTRPQVLWMLGVVAAGAIGMYAYALHEADSRTSDLMVEMRRKFTGLTSADVLDETGTIRTEFLMVGTIRATAYGDQGDASGFDFRYPVDVFGVHRCAFARFTPTGVAFRKASGEVCTKVEL